MQLCWFALRGLLPTPHATLCGCSCSACISEWAGHSSVCPLDKSPFTVLVPATVLSPWLRRLQALHVPPELLCAAYCTQATLQQLGEKAAESLRRLPLWLALLHGAVNALVIVATMLISQDPFIAEVRAGAVLTC